MDPGGRYWYRNGVNPNAVLATAAAALVGLVIVLVPSLAGAAAFNWFIGCALGAAIYWVASVHGPWKETAEAPAGATPGAAAEARP
jgi:NCS1 family nucleobase:cation symporter-1